MRSRLILAILLTASPMTAAAQQGGRLSLPAQGSSPPRPQGAQSPVADTGPPVCLRDADTRKVVCHTLAEWKWIAINRDRPSLDAK